MATRSEKIRAKHSELTEVVERRSEFSKHFDLGGGKFRCVVSEETLHFQDDQGQWQEIEPFAVQAGPNIAVSKAPYLSTTLANEIGFTFQKRGSASIATVKLTHLDDAPLSSVPEPILEDGSAWWRDVATGLDIELKFFEDKAELFKHIKNSSAPTKLTFEKTRSLVFDGHFGEKTLGWDSGSHSNLPMRRAVEIERIDSAWTQQGQTETQITSEEFTGRVQHIDPVTRIKSWQSDVVYPVVIDASVSVTAATSESGYGIDGFTTGWYESAVVVGGRSVPSYTFRGGVRFQSVGIPQGSTVDSAEVQLYGTAATNGSGWKIQVEVDNVDDAVAFSSTSRPESLAGIAAGSGTPALTAAGYFTITGLTTAFQSVISRSGWSSGNAMRVALNPVSASGTYDSQYFDSTTTRPVLNIDYTVGAGPAFTSVGSFIATSSKTNQTTWSPTTSAAISAGDLIIIQLATNNISTTSGVTTNHSTVTVGGQSLTKLREYTEANGSADDGATISLWMLQNSSAQSSGATVAATASTSTARWAISGWKFTCDNNGTVTEETSGYAAENISGADAGSLSTGTITERDYLVIRSEAIEASTGSLTPTSTWTEITGANTTGGAGHTRLGVVGEFKTGTGTSFTSNPTTSNDDQAGVLVALYNSLSASPTVTPPAQTATVSIPTPTITAEQNITLTPSAQSATVSIPTPTVSISVDATVTPAAQTATVSIPTPTVTAEENITLTPSAQTATASIPTPTITAEQNITLTPAVLAATVSIPTPTVTISVDATVTPSAQTATVSIPAPTVTAEQNITLTPAAQAATVSIPAPSVTAEQNITLTPSTLAATVSIPTPTVDTSTNITLTPSALTAIATVQEPTVTAIQNKTLTPSVLAATASLPAPAVTAEENITLTPAASTATVSIPTPTITAEENVTLTPGALTATASLPAPTVTAIQNRTLSPDVLASTVSIPTPTVDTSGNITISPSALTATASIPVPSVTAVQNVTVSPGVLALVASINAPTVNIASGGGGGHPQMGLMGVGV